MLKAPKHKDAVVSIAFFGNGNAFTNSHAYNKNNCTLNCDANVQMDEDYLPGWNQTTIIRKTNPPYRRTFTSEYSWSFMVQC